ncbi:MAG: nucleotidyltransferase family protein [candidate division Zixibacteria bacterium]|jgi:predicted nucleotidyltransferase|nr:nucleotidyltransferase family protein [candidate division Zixibacteria bacterium]
MKTLEEIKKLLGQYKQELEEKFKVKEIGIFGSTIREEQRQTSDIDLLVDFKDEADLFDLMGLGLFLEEKLSQRVDVVPKRAIREEIKDRVLKEVVYL